MEQIGTVVKAGLELKPDQSGMLYKLQVEKFTYTLFDAHHQEVATANLGKRVRVMYEMDKTGKYRNVQSIMPAPDEVPSSGGTQMSPEAWAEKDRLEQWSIESQTAYKGLIELAKTGYEEGTKLAKAIDAALDWALAHLRSIPLSDIKQAEKDKEYWPTHTKAAAQETKHVMNPDRLKESLDKAKWSEARVIDWLKSKANYQGLNLSGKFQDIIDRMSQEQAEFLIKEIADRMGLV